MSEYQVWNELGNLYALSSSYDLAIHAYKTAIQLNPHAGEPCSNLAQVYMQINLYARAAEFYQKSIELLQSDQHRAAALHGLGNAYLQLKEYEQAMEAYQSADKLVPDIRQIIDAFKPSEQFLNSGSGGASGDENIVTIEDTTDITSSGMELLPFIEELTPWWFDGQVPPEEVPSSEDTEVDSVDDPGFVDFNTNATCPEPLQWQTVDSTESSKDGVAPCDEVSSWPVLNPSVDLTSSTEMSETYLLQDPPEISLQCEQRPEHCEAVSSASIEVDLEAPELVPVSIIVDSPEITTEAQEFSEPTLTDPEAIQYKSPTDIPLVKLSQEEQVDLLADIEKIKRTLAINPQNSIAWDTLGSNYKALGKYEDAIQAHRKAVSLDSSKAFYFHHLGLVFAAVGKIEDATGAFERVLEIDPNHGLAHATLGGYYRKSGKEELAQVHITKARILLATDENEYNRACMEAICGNTDQALELLEVALKNKQTYVNWACKDPDLDFIRDDPRFHALLVEYATNPD